MKVLRTVALFWGLAETGNKPIAFFRWTALANPHMARHAFADGAYRWSPKSAINKSAHAASTTIRTKVSSPLLLLVDVDGSIWYCTTVVYVARRIAENIVFEQKNRCMWHVRVGGWQGRKTKTKDGPLLAQCRAGSDRRPTLSCPGRDCGRRRWGPLMPANKLFDRLCLGCVFCEKNRKVKKKNFLNTCSMRRLNKK